MHELKMNCPAFHVGRCLKQLVMFPKISYVVILYKQINVKLTCKNIYLCIRLETQAFASACVCIHAMHALCVYTCDLCIVCVCVSVCVRWGGGRRGARARVCVCINR